MSNSLFLFFYHKNDDITTSCYEQLCSIEGNENVIPVSNNIDYLPNTFCLYKESYMFCHGDDYWMYDGLIYKYVLLNKKLILNKKIIVTLEYDTWWNALSNTWLNELMINYDLLGAEKLTIDKEPLWSFFNRETTLNTEVNKSQLLALRPLAVTCSNPEFLVKVSEFFQDNQVFHSMQNCELRFGTLFNILGARIGTLPFQNIIKWHPWINDNVKNKKGIYHPIKNINTIS
jgi:hypothetical protein